MVKVSDFAAPAKSLSGLISFSVVPDRRLLKNIETIKSMRTRNRIISQASRKVANKLKSKLVNMIKSRKQTGRMSKITVRNIKGKSVAGVAMKSPERKKLAGKNRLSILDSKGYYPAAQEFGSKNGIRPQRAWQKFFQRNGGLAVRMFEREAWALFKAALK